MAITARMRLRVPMGTDISWYTPSVLVASISGDAVDNGHANISQCGAPGVNRGICRRDFEAVLRVRLLSLLVFMLQKKDRK